MKRGVLALFAALSLLGCAQPLRAGNPARGDGGARVIFGFEWGYDLTMLDIHHYNYMDEADGFRIDEKETDLMLYSNGHASANVSLEFARKFSLGLHAGYAGVRQNTRIFPLSLRGTWFADSYGTDGQFVFLEGGAGMHETMKTVLPFARLGYGYRVNLSRRASMDFSASLRGVYDHPRIYDSDNHIYIANENVRKSDACYGAIIFTIGLNF